MTGLEAEWKTKRKRKVRAAQQEVDIMRLVTFQRLNNNGAFDESAPVMPLFGIGAPMREPVPENGMFSFFGEEVGILSKDGKKVLPIAQTGISYPDMNTLIAGHLPEEMEVLRAAAEAIEGLSAEAETVEEPAAAAEEMDTTYAEAEETGKPYAEDCLAVGTDVKILSPIPVPLQDVICLGLNYTEHAEEAAAYAKEAFTSKDRYPVYFAKRVNHSPADGDPVPAYADLVDSLDYEAELAVIIGKDVKGIAPEEVPDCIFGYTILNDFSARNLQTRHTQWYLGKSLDGYTPMGPCIVTADEFSFPPRLRISCTVNGELRQDSTTDMLIFGIDHIISDISRAMTLRAGTIISTGTPKGVGMGFDPPKFLHAGDTVSCEIEGIGTLTNTICD